MCFFVVELQPCPEGATQINHLCYRYYSAPYTWAGATRACEAWGGRLTTARDKEEQVRVRSHRGIAKPKVKLFVDVYRKLV